MQVDYAAQYALFVACLISGCVFGVVSDLIRVFRMLIPHKAVLVFVEDFIFCVFCACVLVIDFYNFSRGRMRVFGYLSAAGSFIAWRLTISRLTERILRALQNFLRPKIKKAASYLENAIDFLRGIVYTCYMTSRMRRKASRGFGLYRH